MSYCDEKGDRTHIYRTRARTCGGSMAKPVYILIDEKLLKEFDRARKKFGYNRSVAIREAMRQFVERVERSRKKRR